MPLAYGGTSNNLISPVSYTWQSLSCSKGSTWVNFGCNIGGPSLQRLNAEELLARRQQPPVRFQVLMINTYPGLQPFSFSREIPLPLKGRYIKGHGNFFPLIFNVGRGKYRYSNPLTFYPYDTRFPSQKQLKFESGQILLPALLSHTALSAASSPQISSTISNSSGLSRQLHIFVVSLASVVETSAAGTQTLAYLAWMSTRSLSWLGNHRNVSLLSERVLILSLGIHKSSFVRLSRCSPSTACPMGPSLWLARSL